MRMVEVAMVHLHHLVSEMMTMAAMEMKMMTTESTSNIDVIFILTLISPNSSKLSIKTSLSCLKIT